MVTAIPINKKGEQIGEPVNFSDNHWERMVNNFGKHLAFKKIDSNESNLIVSDETKELETVSTKKAKKKDEK